MKKKLSLLIAVLMLGTVLCTTAVNAKEYEVNETYEIAGKDVAPISGKITIYPNDTNATRILSADEYGSKCFRWSKLMVFDSEGALIEAGGELLANEDGTFGSPQLSVKVPAGGFLIAFDGSGPKTLSAAFEVAMEGAMLYNATMSIIYDMHGSYDKKNNTFTLSYDKPVAPSANAIKFLFIGNSTTYFNGSPIKFKGLARAAGVEVDVDYSTFGSAFLHQFADATHSHGIFMRNKLNTNKYDYVVLQDAASASYQDSIASLETIIPLIKANGAEPVFYMRYSSSGDFAEREQNAYRYHKNYTAFAQKYNAKCSPVADAYMTSLKTNPDIELLADDRSHHSSEGSYLMACCWLYSYLGIDPRGNSYTANLPEATAKALQEAAYITCTKGYKYPPDPGLVTTIDGEEYQNVALGCVYTSTGEPYDPTAAWTDTDQKTGKSFGKYTDGTFATSPDDGAIGGYKGTDVSITIDLGVQCDIKRIASDLFGNNWGLPSPVNAKATVQFSANGKTFTSPAQVKVTAADTSAGWEKRDLTYDAPDGTKARYVRFNYSLDRIPDKYYCVWSSEIAVYGVRGEESAVLGDIDGNGKIDAVDYVMVKRSVLNTFKLDEYQKSAADVNCDGTVDAVDYVMIKRHVLGTYTI